MTLLEFARGTGMQWALTIFALGVGWRLVGIFLLLWSKDLSKPRSEKTVTAGLRTIGNRAFPPDELEKKVVFQHTTGWIWHLGFFITLFFFGPHIPFFKSIFGFGWPNLPNTLVTVTGAITLAILLALLIRRMMHPVMRLISNFDDYISTLLCILPLATGLMAYSHVGLRYETMLGLHLLSVLLLIAWFPFGKLMHPFLTFPSRFAIGAVFQRRGVKA